MRKPAQPPWGVLLRTAREAAGETLEAAARACQAAGGPSMVRWSQIELGYGRRDGDYYEVPGSKRHVAHMAHYLHVTPERLITAGRPDAAAVLEEILLRTPVPEPADLAGDTDDLPPEDYQWDDPFFQRIWDDKRADRRVRWAMIQLGRAMAAAQPLRRTA